MTRPSQQAAGSSSTCLCSGLRPPGGPATPGPCPSPCRFWTFCQPPLPTFPITPKGLAPLCGLVSTFVPRSPFSSPQGYRHGTAPRTMAAGSCARASWRAWCSNGAEPSRKRFRAPWLPRALFQKGGFQFLSKPSSHPLGLAQESPSASLGTGPAGPFHPQSSAECGLWDVSGPSWVMGLRSQYGH